MKMFRQYYFFFVLLATFAQEFLGHAQQQYDQSGFISLDCGIPRNSNYTEPSTQLNYISDAAFINSGTSYSIAPEFKSDKQEQIRMLRSFPDGIRNCYTINVTARTRYLIRATFLHGNYDGLNTVPEFDLHLGANFWTTVALLNVSSVNLKEILHIPPQDYVRICLVNTGSGTPFVSALELRPMSNLVYYNDTGSSQSLALNIRLDTGSVTDLAYRFPYDIIDRAWVPYNSFALWNETSTSNTISANSTMIYRPPSIVMSTAATSADEREPMEFYIDAVDSSTTYYFFMHFSEVQQLKENEYRVFDININKETFFSSLVPVYLKTTTIYSSLGYSGSTRYTFSINRVKNSTLPPILNALEVFYALDFSQSETDEKDVDAISKIKSSYGVNKRNWDGDPCAPRAYLWTGLNCSYENSDPPRITALNLSSSGLTGEITSHIAKLTLIESLDLSNNNLTGSVPDFLSQLPNLRILNLERNNLTGPIPDGLIQKVNSGSLSLSVGENLNLCGSSECDTTKKKNSNILIPVVASVGGFAALLLVATAVFIGLKKKNRQGSTPENEAFKSIKRQFTYSEVQDMTNNFERILGEGGYGIVYHGLIDDNIQVAVKILSSSSTQGYQQFQAEVNHLMKVYHGNLTSLVGYCNEGTNLALIYEFMANGDLGSHLSGKSRESELSWEGRLHIAIDAAQGLEYLHSGCKPPIVHRDVKPANILLTENFRAKLSDFGLSRSFSPDVGTHVSTVVAGTPGYLDPAYYVTSRLNEKSDVYSFGVVLLEIITKQPAIFSTRDEPPERVHVSQWVGFMLRNGVITSVVDPGLRGDFGTNSAWKAVEIAMACVSPTPANRPNMSEVVSVLKECLAAELARKNSRSGTDSSYDSNEVLPLQATPTEFSPFAR